MQQKANNLEGVKVSLIQISFSLIYFPQCRRVKRRSVVCPKWKLRVRSTNRYYGLSDTNAAAECRSRCVASTFVVTVSTSDAAFASRTKSTHITAPTASRPCRRPKPGNHSLQLVSQVKQKYVVYCSSFVDQLNKISKTSGVQS